MLRGEHHFVVERVVVPQRERDLTADVEGVADVAARIPNGVGVVVDVTRAALTVPIFDDGGPGGASASLAQRLADTGVTMLVTSEAAAMEVHEALAALAGQQTVVLAETNSGENIFV